MRRAVRALVLLGAISIGLVVPRSARAENVHPALDELAGCVRQHAVLDVLMLFDSSGSLRRTDPDGQRFVAAKLALTQLNQIAAGQASGHRVAVRVRIAQFAGEY